MPLSKKGPQVCLVRLSPVALCLLLAASGAGAQQVRGSLQEAVLKAPDGSTLIVAPGIYKERIVIEGKSLKIVAGKPDPKNPGSFIPGGHPFDHVIINPDGGLGESLVTVVGGPRTTVVLEGFSFRKGWAVEGGALSIRGSARCTVLRCVFSDNRADVVGGAVFVEPEAGVGISGSAFIHNEAKEDGAAVFVADGERKDPVALVGLTVAGNRGGRSSIFLGPGPNEPCLFNNLFTLNETPLDALSTRVVLAHFSVLGRTESVRCGQGCLVGAQPKFLDLERGNFRLAPGSIGIDAGFGDPPCDFVFLSGDFEGDPPFDDPATPNQGGGKPAYRDIGADEYLPVFIRADSNADGAVDIGDPVSVLDYLFRYRPVSCDDAADGNDDGALDIADAVWVLSYLFAAGPPPPAPFPTPGIDPTPDSLGCAYYGAYPTP